MLYAAFSEESNQDTVTNGCVKTYSLVSTIPLSGGICSFVLIPLFELNDLLFYDLKYFFMVNSIILLHTRPF